LNLPLKGFYQPLKLRQRNDIGIHYPNNAIDDLRRNGGRKQKEPSSQEKQEPGIIRF
jgi:hypothetical protein